MLDKSLVVDFWLQRDAYDTDFHISDLGYLFLLLAFCFTYTLGNLARISSPHSKNFLDLFF